MNPQFAPTRNVFWGAALVALAILLSIAPTAAQHPAPAAPGGTPVRIGALALIGTWARATPPMARTGAIYLTIGNEGHEPDRLLSAATPAAGAAELHAHVMEGGMARMNRVDAIDIKAGESAVFQPAGLHIMLVDLRAPLRDGERISLTLRFARAGSVTLDVPIYRTAPSGRGASPQPHQH